MTLTDEQLQRALNYRFEFSRGVADRVNNRQRGASLVLPDWMPADLLRAKELGYSDGYDGRPRDSTKAYDLDLELADHAESHGGREFDA